jgi:hypothetical protein
MKSISGKDSFPYDRSHTGECGKTGWEPPEEAEAREGATARAEVQEKGA